MTQKNPDSANLQSEHDMIYICNEPAIILKSEYTSDTPAKCYLVSCPLYEFHKHYAQKYLGISFPKPGNKEIVQLGRKDCTRIWKAMRTHERGEIVVLARKFFPQSCPAHIQYAWIAKEIFEQSGGIQILRYRKAAEPSFFHAIIKIDPTVFHRWQVEQDWNIS